MKRFMCLLWGSSICVLLATHCTPTNDERCDSDDDYDPKTGNCIPPGADGDGDSDTGGISDGGVDDGGTGDLPEGFGRPCTDTGNECEEYPEATYCAVDPNTSIGACTVADCTADSGDCPDDFGCCEMVMDLGMPNFCVPKEALGESPLNMICKQ